MPAAQRDDGKPSAHHLVGCSFYDGEVVPGQDLQRLKLALRDMGCLIYSYEKGQL